MEPAQQPQGQGGVNAADWNLTPKIREALDLIGRSQGAFLSKKYDLFMKQNGLFGEQKYLLIQLPWPSD